MAQERLRGLETINWDPLIGKKRYLGQRIKLSPGVLGRSRLEVG